MKRILPLMVFFFLTSCEARRLERLGFAKCDEGLRIVKACDALFRKSPLTDPEKDRLRTDLHQARVLIQEGFVHLEQAGEKAGGKSSYEITPYREALIVVRKRLQELR